MIRGRAPSLTWDGMAFRPAKFPFRPAGARATIAQPRCGKVSRPKSQPDLRPETFGQADGGVWSRDRCRFRRGIGIWSVYTRTISQYRRPARARKASGRLGPATALPCRVFAERRIARPKRCKSRPLFPGGGSPRVFPIAPIIQPARHIFIPEKRIGRISQISTPCSDYSADMRQPYDA